MTKKISDMSAEQLLSYEAQREKNRNRMRSNYKARSSDPAFKAKSALANRKWAASSAYFSRADVKQKNASRMRQKYQDDPVFAAERRAYWAMKREQPDYKPVRLAKQRGYAIRYKNEKQLNEQFAAFMARLELEEIDHGKQGQ